MRIILLSVSFILSLLTIHAQHGLTPYDDCPGLINNYKPAWQDNYPDWGKMLYQIPVNFKELTSLYKASNQKNKEEFKAIERYYKLWTRALSPWVMEDGSIQLPDKEKYELALRQNQLQKDTRRTDSKANRSSWTFVGPKETFWLNESGSATTPAACPWQLNIYSFDIFEGNDSILYTGTETGLVNKTMNKGDYWEQCAFDYPFGGGIAAVAIHPTNPDVVYVSGGNQLHKTIDGGHNWTPLLAVGNQFATDRLRLDNQHPDTLFAASNNGLFITTDAGITWTKKWNFRAYDVEINPGNHQHIITLSKSGTSFRVAQSLDGGQNFSSIASFPQNLEDVSGGLIAMSAANTDALWVLLLSSNNTPLLYRYQFTTDTWTLLATGQTSALGLNNGQGYFDLILEVAPDNADFIFAGTTTLYKSNDGGIIFTAIGGYTGPFPIHPDIQDMKILPGNLMWVATDGGMTYSSDLFNAEVNAVAKNKGMIGSDMWGFDQGWNESLMVGGRYHNGNTAMSEFYQDKAIRMGGAESPTGWIMKGKSRHVAFDDLGNGWILPQTAEGQPEGRFIFSKFPNMNEYGGRRGNIAIHPYYYGVMYLGEGTGIWKTEDQGVTWSLISNFSTTVRFIQISDSNPDVLYVDVDTKGLYRSEDGGYTWVQKPSLTSGTYGTAYWKGKLHFVISPSDENTVYAILQNGMWSNDLGKVFKSVDGGDTWENITGSLSEYMKVLVIQPDENGDDLVYLFTNEGNGKSSSVYYRTQTMSDWEPYVLYYPAGIDVNYALPFFRDGKIRMAGGAGVWENSLVVPDFKPIIHPWVERPFFNCMLDTIQLEDHSILNHQNCSWHWEISPAPVWLENPDVRNPKLVLGNPGSYTVTLTVTKDGIPFSTTILNMITTTTCPSIEDCSNPAAIPQDTWNLVSVDSEEAVYPGLAAMAFDGDPETIWHTGWVYGDDPYPHEMIIDLGNRYKFSSFTLLNRQDGENGRIKEYELYLSDTLNVWPDVLSAGQWINTSAPQTITFSDKPIGRYMRLVALSEVNGNPWASAAEISWVGCINFLSQQDLEDENARLNAFPVPSNGLFNLQIPDAGRFSLIVIDASGKKVLERDGISGGVDFILDLQGKESGIYFLKLVNEMNNVFTVSLIIE
ncbi:MAG: discoidin domain-containing protein [Bacteroidales bacterium]|nr:discoidin domain-containing protein [Bacteroidales bacterium]